MEHTALALCVRVLITLYLHVRFWWLSHCWYKYTSTELLTLVDKVLPKIQDGFTRSTRNVVLHNFSWDKSVTGNVILQNNFSWCRWHLFIVVSLGLPLFLLVLILSSEMIKYILFNICGRFILTYVPIEHTTHHTTN